eukprot:Hpha_TRINITY_DN15800_c7_g1::TRINITY_DN15800_c7_g1_i1::g.187042::m.187042
MESDKNVRRNQEKRIRTIPTAALFGFSAVVSTLVSAAGGLLLYFEGISAIDATLRDVAAAESLVVSGRLSSYFDGCVKTSNTISRFLSKADYIQTVPQLQRELRGLVMSVTMDQRLISGAGVGTAFYDNIRAGSQELFWWDPLEKPDALAANNGSNQLFATAFHSEDNICADDTLNRTCLQTYSLNSNQENMDNIYNFSRRIVPEAEKPFWMEYGNRWQDVWSWKSPDGTPYYYLEFTVVHYGLIPGHPVLGGMTEILMWVMLYDWITELNSVGATGEFMAVDAGRGLEGTVFAASWWTKAAKCGTQTVDREDSCVVKIKDLEREAQEAVTVVNEAPPGDVIRATLNGADYFVVRRSVHEGRQHDLLGRIDCVWLLDAASVEGRVLRTLLYFVGFLVGVILIDSLILAVEVQGFVLPLRRLRMAMSYIDDMDIDRLDEALESVVPGPVAVNDIMTLTLAFRRAAAHLRGYRNYLPDGLLEDNEQLESSLITSEDTEVFSLDLEANKSPTNKTSTNRRKSMLNTSAAIVFTDVQSSTMLWEAYPQDMYDSLMVHNSTLREVARECSGYEVKIIGDAMMLAFSAAKHAVRFGAEAQLRLTQRTWPSELCKHPLCKHTDGPRGAPLWNGIRIRIGINWGKVKAELNPVTGRYDFFGGTVNTASRVEAELKLGGLTGVTQAVIDEVGVDFMNDQFTVPMGERELKGVAQPVMIHIVLPKALAGRWAELTQPSPKTDSIESDAVNMQRISGLSNIPSISFSKTPRLEAGLMLSDATCATVRGAFGYLLSTDEAETAATQFLVAVETSVLRTQGQLMSVVSAMCIAAWNARIRCPEHLEQAARFITLLPPTVPTHIGVAPGPVLSGNIAGSRRRNVTVAGSCVELSLELARAALAHDLRFMAAGEVGNLLGKDGLAEEVKSGTALKQVADAHLWVPPSSVPHVQSTPPIPPSFSTWGHAIPPSAEVSDEVNPLVVPPHDTGIETLVLDRGGNNPLNPLNPLN